MNNDVRPSQMLFIFMNLITIFTHISPNLATATVSEARWISGLLSSAIVLVVSLLLVRFANGVSYFDACAGTKGLTEVFASLLGVLFVVFGSMIFKSTIDTTKANILYDTPRPMVAFILAATVLAGAYVGTGPVGRFVRFIFPLSILLFFVIMIFSSLTKAELTNLYPILGSGVKTIAKNGIQSAISVLFVFVLLIDLHKQPKPARLVVFAVLISGFIVSMAALAFQMVTPPGAISDTAFPLQQIATLNGFSRFFQRMRSLFVFIWIPTYTSCVALCLGYAARCLAQALHIENPRALLMPLLLIVLCLGLPMTQHSPAWLLAIMQKSPLYFIALPVLLLPMVIHKIKAKKEAKRHA